MPRGKKKKKKDKKSLTSLTPTPFILGQKIIDATRCQNDRRFDLEENYVEQSQHI